jgi:hypothetical protein
MEYENCSPTNLGNNMLMYAAVILVVLFIIYYFSQMKQHAVGIRGANWIDGVYVNNNPRRRPKW